jgi:uncharacterized protein (TIGR00661 family)
VKILYGVQATGNGHISRSQEVIVELKQLGHQVTVLLSGKTLSAMWDLEALIPYHIFRGLTFSSHKGRINYLQTLLRLNLFRFYQDINSFDARNFDLVVTDFEPLSARIARREKIPCIGLSHQCAFLYDIPVAGANPLARLILKRYAPVDFPIGFHWHHFNQPILPPIVSAGLKIHRTVQTNKILVYLPFESLGDIKLLIRSFPDFQFYVYHSLKYAEDCKHIHLRPFSRNGFIKDLIECHGVIANAGFELASEALHLGKKILVKPLAGQMEQVSNALVLSQLNLGRMMHCLDSEVVAQWLDSPEANPIRYPNVAHIIAQWIESGQFSNIAGLAQTAWNQVRPQRQSVSIPTAFSDHISAAKLTSKY